MKDVAAIGTYTGAQTELLRQEFDPLFLRDPAGAAALSEGHRREIRAVAFTGHAGLDGPVMDLLPNLKLISNFGVGYDAIDVEAARARGIAVTNTPDILNDDVADCAVAMLLMQARGLVPAERWARSGKWASEGAFRLTRKVSGGRVGIVGLGRIGREIADRLAAFKMDIHYFARSEKETPGWTYHGDPVSLARAVDFLIVILVGGKATEKFVSAQVIDALGPEGVIVNISRGTTVDEAALLDALENRRIAGAALDVFVSEPDFDRRFTALDNVVLLPHVGSATEETRAAMAKLQRDNIHAFRRGDALLTRVV